MIICLSQIDWQAVAAIATLTAVIVALIPIWRETRRQKAYARCLRLRLGSKLTLLRPSIVKITRRGSTKYPSAILSKEEFQEEIRAIGTLLTEASVLDTEEQDNLGIVYLNLQMASNLYGSPDLTDASAKQILTLIQRAMSAMENRGLLHRHIEFQWEEENKN